MPAGPVDVVKVLRYSIEVRYKKKASLFCSERLFFYCSLFDALGFAGGGGGGVIFISSSFIICGGSFVIVFLPCFDFGFAGGGGGGAGGAGSTFTSLSGTIVGGANSTFSTLTGGCGGGGGGTFLFCACVTRMIHTRQAGNNNIFFINSFLVRHTRAIIPQSFYN